jgi:hypothetical protein
MSNKLLVIIPCGQTKIWKKNPNYGTANAKDAYTGPPFKVNRAFAELFADKWLILSAKYGFIEPDFPIPKDYDVTFKKLSTNPISLNALKKQYLERNLSHFNLVIALGGEDYTSMVNKVFSGDSIVLAPARGLILGKGMQRIKSLSTTTREEMLKRITES